MKLDIGCGDRETKIGEDYIGVDIDDYELRAGHPELSPEIIGDARWLPFKDETIDEVFSGACIGLYVGEDGFNEAMRVLKPGGRIRFRIMIMKGRFVKLLTWIEKSDLLIIDIEPINYAEESFLVEGGSDTVIVDDVMITLRKR